MSTFAALVLLTFAILLAITVAVSGYQQRRRIENMRAIEATRGDERPW